MDIEKLCDLQNQLEEVVKINKLLLDQINDQERQMDILKNNIQDHSNYLKNFNIDKQINIKSLEETMVNILTTKTEIFVCE